MTSRPCPGTAKPKKKNNHDHHQQRPQQRAARAPGQQPPGETGAANDAIVVLDDDGEVNGAQERKGDADKELDLAHLVGSEKEAQNVFVVLRKAANHPLLLRQ